MVNETYDYIASRLTHQISYFEAKARRSKLRYLALKSASIVCNILTALTIGIAFSVDGQYSKPVGLLALFLSIAILATYQWEEFSRFGLKWERARIAAERLKAEQAMYLTRAGHYAELDDAKRLRLLVETVESILRGSDSSFFALQADPSERIERGVQKG